MHSERVHYGTCQKKCYILYLGISHVDRLVSIDTFVLTLKTFPGILLSEFKYIEVIDDVSARVS